MKISRLDQVDADSLILDASVLINLLGTRRIDQLTRACPQALLVPMPALHEVTLNPVSKTSLGSEFDQLLADSRLRLIELKGHEADMVVELSSSLGLGESSVISVAKAREEAVVLDDKKAIGVANRLGVVDQFCSLDLIAQSAVESVLGEKEVQLAVFDALRFSRMRVLPHHHSWITGFLTQEQLNQCSSLKSSSLK